MALYWTLNQHLDNLKAFGINHKMIHSVGAGDRIKSDLNTKEQVYPQMWIQFLNCKPDTHQLFWTFRFIFYSIPKDDYNVNIEDIHSDMTNVCLDLLSYFKNGPFRSIYTFVSNSDILPFTEKYQNIDTGVYVDITYKTPFSYAACDLPMDDFTIVQGIPQGDIIFTSDIYTISATLEGTTAVFLRNDTATYSLDLSSFSGGGTGGATGPQGFQGPTGPQGSNGIDGATGPQGFQGDQGFQGPTGPQGSNGIDGATGPQGFQGDQGFQGPTGPQGIDGATGPQGFQGATGPQGASGAGIGATGTPTEVLYYDNSGNLYSDGFFTRDSVTNQSVQILSYGPSSVIGYLNGDQLGLTAAALVVDDGNQNLIIAVLDNSGAFQGSMTYDDGNINTAVVINQNRMQARYVGLTTSGEVELTTDFSKLTFVGASGSNMLFVDEFGVSVYGPSYNYIFPQTGGNDGEFLKRSGALGNTVWATASGTQGPQGSQGPQGLQGPIGPQGFQGDQGFQGPTGPQGDQGFQGPTGPQGFQGFQGSTGPASPIGQTGTPTEVLYYDLSGNLYSDFGFIRDSSTMETIIARTYSNVATAIFTSDTTAGAPATGMIYYDSVTAEGLNILIADNSGTYSALMYYSDGANISSIVSVQLAGVVAGYIGLTTSGILEMNQDFSRLQFSDGVSNEVYINGTGVYVLDASSNPLLHVKNDGNVGIGIGNPLGFLNIKSGTTAFAPIVLTSGGNTTTPKAGAIEYDGTSLYQTNSTLVRGTVRTNRLLGVTASSLTMNNLGYTRYVFSGSTASTWTMFSLSNTAGKDIYIHNRGTETITLNSNAGANDFSDLGVAVNTKEILAGENYNLYSDGTYFIIN